MVVEADYPNNLWGTDTAGANITVSAFGQVHNTTTNGDGIFSVTLGGAPKSVVPTTITISSSSGDSISLSDVLVGHTVVCSGRKCHTLLSSAEQSTQNMNGIKHFCTPL